MTQPNDPWAAASAAPPATSAPAPEQSGIDAGYGAATGSSLLFNAGVSAPSFFNKTHPLGTERSGIITGTKDVQDQDFNAKAPKYWSHSKTGGPKRNHAITLDAVDTTTGTPIPNRPVMVTHVSLDTDYRITADECVATGRDVAYVGQDTGKRVDVIGGFDFEPFAKAMVEARSRGITLNDASDLVGKRYTKKRVAQKPNPGGYPSWINEYRIDDVRKA